MPRASQFQQRPQILAHRMLRMGYPENTLLSLEKVIELGIDWIEFDVQVLPDGEIVSMHDSKVDRTTDGTGILIQKSYDEVKKLNASKGYSVGFVPVPKVEEIIKMVSEAPYPLRAEMHIHNLEEPEILLKMLYKYNVIDRCYFNTGMIPLAQYIRQDLDDHQAKISFNISSTNIEDYRQLALDLDVSYYCVPIKYLTEDYIQQIHAIRPEKPIYVHCFPVQMEDLWEKMLAIGVDVIQTDFPEAFREFLEEKGFNF